MAMAGELIGVGHSWSSLPDELMERILRLLPLACKLSCKCVCKSWNSILSSDKLLSYTTNSSTSNGYGNACFLLTTKGPFAYTLDPPTNIWQKLSKPDCPGTSILAAAQGLVCVGNQVSECRSLNVFNLLSNTWKLLPNMLQVGLLHKVSMAVDTSTNAYVIVVTGENSSEFRGRHAYRLLTEVYDSVTSSWRMAGDALPEAKFGSDPGVWCNGLFYCITELPYGLIAFNLAKGCWIELNVEMPKGIAFPSLLSCMGQLLMVGIQDASIRERHHDDNVNASSPSQMPAPSPASSSVLSPRAWPWSGPLQLWTSSPLLSMMTQLPLLSPVHQSPSSPSSSPPPPLPSKSIRLWSFCHGKQWRMLDKMPEELCTEFMSHLTVRTPLVCAGVGEDVCITSHRSPNAAVFNIRNKVWRFAECDPLFPKNRDSHLLGFTNQPDYNCIP